MTSAPLSSTKDLDAHLRLVNRNCVSADTPSLRRVMDAKGEPYGVLADPADVAQEALSHLADGPTWTYGSANPGAGSPLATLSRREAVLIMSRGARPVDQLPDEL